MQTDIQKLISAGLAFLLLLSMMPVRAHAAPSPMDGALGAGMSDPAVKTLTVEFEAGDYELVTTETGETTLKLDSEFGTFGAPGEPSLPGRVHRVGLPPGAQVTGVRFTTPQTVELAGTYQLEAVKPAITDPQDSLEAALARWRQGHARAYASDAPTPQTVGVYQGQDQWRRYAYARIAYQPFTYRPRSGRLVHHPKLVAQIDYVLPPVGDDIWRQQAALRNDHVLDDFILPNFVNAEAVRAWYQDPATDSTHDYVVIVPDDAMAAELAPFKSWKESLGHSVMIVTLEWIDQHYSGVDVADQIWNFLHDKYPASAWGVRYVMLVGDMQAIPTRRVYYADAGWGLRSDHFYAKLSGGATSAQVWNRDGDVRWGEIHDDELDIAPDVLVGRVPLNNTADVAAAVQAMIRYEKDAGNWKYWALLAGGYNSIRSASDKTDNAVLLEKLRTDLLEPGGWRYTRLYEQSGLGTTAYPPTTPPSPVIDVSEANLTQQWNNADHGLVVLLDHGGPGGMSGLVWQVDANGDGDAWDSSANEADAGEIVWSDLLRRVQAPNLTNPKPAVVALFGCATHILVTPPWPTPDQSLTAPGGYTPNTGSELLRQGAAAGTVGFYSAVPYSVGWNALSNGNVQTFAHYFVEELVSTQSSLGQAVFTTKLRYNNGFYNNNYQPFHWAFNLFGDPSMIIAGYDRSAQGSNRKVHSGPVYAFGTDNDDNGDMYVAVSIRASDTDGRILVYRSVDHGDTWEQWATVDHTEGIRAVDVLVGRWENDEFSDNRLLLFFADNRGKIYVERLKLANPGDRQRVLVADAGGSQVITNISVARDPTPMPAFFNVYIAWGGATGHLISGKRSPLNGAVWNDSFTYEGYGQPHIDAGPNKHVYLTAVGTLFPSHVYVKRSLDQGATWEGWINLSAEDNGDSHSTPVVAASTDAAIPTVWVAYTYYRPVTLGAADVRVAYSEDGGGSWTKDQTLSAEAGKDELFPDMVGYRAGPSRWMNVVYNHTQPLRTNVIWRWSSGSTPITWRTPRPVNDHDTHPAMGPQVIYSPGAPLPGSGAVYNGGGSPVTNLYFAAPWLSAPLTRAQLTTDAASERAPAAEARTASPSPRMNVEVNLPNWAVTGPLGAAYRVAGLAQHPTGILFAAATTAEINERNTGAVFRSDDGGEHWGPVPRPEDAWWLDSILVTHEGTLLTGGMNYTPAARTVVVAEPYATIQRSTDLGEQWTQAAAPSGATTVRALFQRANGDIIASVAPGARLLVSGDDGAHWEPMPTPPEAMAISAFYEAGDGTLYAGGAMVSGRAAVYRLDSDEWQLMGELAEAKAVHALAGAGEQIYAGVTGDDGKGYVYTSADRGQQWRASAAIGESQGVSALLVDPAGNLYAGLDMGAGNFTSYVYEQAETVRGANEEAWHPVGDLYQADAVRDLLLTPDGRLYAASGDVYGVVYYTTIPMPPAHWLYLPVIESE